MDGTTAGARGPAADQQVRDVAPLPGFADAAAVVLEYLQATYGLGLWMVTRTVGEDWIVLSSTGDGYPVDSGDVFRWSDSFCSRMVLGHGPRVAPRAADVPAYAEAPIGRALEIGTYVGVPLTGPDGELFGTLCAIDPAPSHEALSQSQPLFELQARLLSSLLAVELTAERESRRAELAERRAHVDALTGAVNRGGWDVLLSAEELRCRRHSSPASVVVLDLDGLKQRNDELGHTAGDALLRTAADVLLRHVRSGDVVARTGGDEFAVLCPETAEPGTSELAARLRAALEEAGVAASVGVAAVDPRDHDLQATWRRADQAMYADKAVRRGVLPRQRRSLEDAAPVRA